jgi:hypothetical protein
MVVTELKRLDRLNIDGPLQFFDLDLRVPMWQNLYHLSHGSRRPWRELASRR